jgi:hypothetical protein
LRRRKKRAGEKNKKPQVKLITCGMGDYENLLTAKLLTGLSSIESNAYHPAKWISTDVEIQIIHNAANPITVPLKTSFILNC